MATRFIFSLKGMLQLAVQTSIIGILNLWFWVEMDGNFAFKVLFTIICVIGLGREYYKFKAEQLE
jgi:hypothetical protein